MGLIGGSLGYNLLRRIAPAGDGLTRMDGSAFANRSKLGVLLGETIFEKLAGKTVLDFGCGTGAEAVELAERGAARVIGLDIQERFLVQARALAHEKGVGDRCEFVDRFDGQVESVTSIDAFEHFDDPAAILALIARLLSPTGRLYVSFGPTWYHPLGGHLFSVFPWAHLLFTERALIRWRSDFKTDGATRFSEVAGGLNQMTIARFEKLVAASPLRFESFETVPIRGLARFHSRLTREFTSAIVRATLVRRDSASTDRR